MLGWVELGLSLGFDNWHGDIFPGNICPYQEYLRCYLPDFTQTLKLGSWDHLYQMPTVTVAYAQATYVLETFVHISNNLAVGWWRSG